MNILNLVKIVILGLFSILPDSPFGDYFDTLEFAYYEYLNWFLPLDVCVEIFRAWLACVVIYFIWIAILKKIVLILVNKVLPAVIAFFL